MEFGLDETQHEVKELAAEVLRRTAERDQSDGGALTETGYDEPVWQAMADAGLLALAVPEELGGDGLGLLESAVVLTEVGRRTAQVPAVASLAFGVLPVAQFGTREQQEELLKGVQSGRVLTAALNEPSSPMPRRPRTTAVREDRDLVVSGTKIGVMHADSADRMLVSVHIPGDGDGVVLIDPAADGVSLHRTPTSSGASECTVQLDAVRIAGTNVLGGSTEQRILEGLHGFALSGICAAAHGGLAGALDLTSEYLSNRTQFGRPLASFQAVAQQVADVYVVARTFGLATWSACWALATGRDASEDLEVAALWLADEVPAAMHTCQHLHGGMGVDVTYPLHRHFSLIKDLARCVGGADHRLDRLAETVAS